MSTASTISLQEVEQIQPKFNAHNQPIIGRKVVYTGTDTNNEYGKLDNGEIVTYDGTYMPKSNRCVVSKPDPQEQGKNIPAIVNLSDLEPIGI